MHVLSFLEAMGLVLFGSFCILRGAVCFFEERPFFFLTGHVIVGRKINEKIQYAIREQRAFIFKSRYLDLKYGGTTKNEAAAFTDNLERCLEIKRKLTKKKTKPKEFVVKDKGNVKLI